MAGPCIADTDCVALDLTADVLTASPIIAPASNSLICSVDGLYSNVQGGEGTTEFQVAPGQVAINVNINGDASNILVVDANALLVRGYPTQVFTTTVAGGAAIPIIGAPAGVVGPTLSLTVTNPSPVRNANFLVILRAGAEEVSMDTQAIWVFYGEVQINGGGFTPFDLRRYDTNYAFTAAARSRQAFGGMTAAYSGTLIPSGSVTYDIRKSLTVEATGLGAGDIESTGYLKIDALVVTT